MQLYKHSGRCGTWGVPAAAGAGILTGLVLGLVYTYIVNWIPLIYVSAFATAGFGFCVGYAVVWGAKLGKMRNVPIAVLTAGLVGLIATYFAWVFDPMARLDMVDQPIWRLEMLWEYMKLGYEKGFWSIGHVGQNGGGAVTGPFLVAVWIAEAGIIIGVACVTVKNLLGNQPYCEETDQWTKTQKNVATLSLVNDDQANAKLQELLAGNLDSLQLFYHADASDSAYARLDLATCPDCPTCNYLTVTMIQHVVNKKGQVTKQENKLLANLQVAPEEVERIRTAGIERPAAPEPVAAEQDSAKVEA